MTDPTATAWVEGSMRYLPDRGARPVMYNRTPGQGLVENVGNHRDYRVRVHDARPVARDFSLDRQGFRLMEHQSRVRNFFDRDEVQATYYPEIAALIAAVSGAPRVEVMSHAIRVSENSEARAYNAPALQVHNDFSDLSGPIRARKSLSPDEADAVLGRRFAQYTVWRPIRGPLTRFPLGLVDASTIAPDDLMPCDLVHQENIPELYHGVYNPAHRWYYTPAMAPTEVLVFKCYDSALDGRSRFCLHSAFDDPTTPPDAPPRESIEARGFAFF